MATNRAMLKEAIADAKAVKETAIANAKAALEEAFTPQLKSMLSMKLQEMNDDEDLEETYMYEEDEDLKEMHGKKEDDMMEVDLEELLAELEEDEMEEGLYEAEKKEEETEETEETEEETEDEGEPIDLEDMTDEDLKSMIEDVIADMIKSGELEAGSESEEAEIEPEEVEDVKDEEDVDLAELLREIEEMEDGGISDTEGIDGIKKIFRDGEISPEEIKAALQDILDSTPEEIQGLKDEAKEVISEIKSIMEANSELTKEEILAKVKEEVIEWYKKSKRNKWKRKSSVL